MASTSQTASHDPENSEREFISLLIDLYRDCPELWKVKSKDYFNRNKRSAAFEKIVGALRNLKPDFSVKQLKQKINVLRTNFNREFKAIEAKKVSGISTDDIPEPSLWYYNDMYFIKDQLEIAQTATSEQPIPDEDLNLESVGSPADVVTRPTLKRAIPANTGKKRKGGPDSTDQLLGLATEYFKRPETEEDILAKGWAMKLKKLAPDQRRFAEKIINDTLFEAEMGTLTREGVHCGMYPNWNKEDAQQYDDSTESNYVKVELSEAAPENQTKKKSNKDEPDHENIFKNAAHEMNKSTDGDGQQQYDEATQNSDIKDEPNETAPEKQTRKRGRKDDPGHDYPFKRAAYEMNKSTDDFNIFGDYVASELRNLRSTENQRRLKLDIQRAILRASEIDVYGSSPPQSHSSQKNTPSISCAPSRLSDCEPCDQSS